MNCVFRSHGVKRKSLNVRLSKAMFEPQSEAQSELESERVPRSSTWHRAWADAATGATGFWRSQRVADHFRTASNSRLLAQMIARLLRTRPQITSVVEIGAGDGRLLRALRPLLPRIRLTGVDLRPAAHPTDLIGIEWQVGHYDTFDARWHPQPPAVRTGESTMIICAEWLDDLPCPVAAPDGEQWREVLVRADGSELLGDRLPAVHAEWLRRWWPTPTPDDGQPEVRAEVGSTRDRAWAGLIASLRDSGGTALMIDYGHRIGDRPTAGSLTAYAAGRQQRPRPDPAINLTADVAVDAVAAAGVEAGATTDLLITQRQAVEQLLPSQAGEPAADRGSDPLRRLQERSERHAIGSVLGDHWWLLQDVPATGRQAGVARTPAGGEAD